MRQAPELKDLQELFNGYFIEHQYSKAARLIRNRVANIDISCDIYIALLLEMGRGKC